MLNTLALATEYKRCLGDNIIYKILKYLYIVYVHYLGAM